MRFGDRGRSLAGLVVAATVSLLAPSAAWADPGLVRRPGAQPGARVGPQPESLAIGVGARWDGPGTVAEPASTGRGASASPAGEDEAKAGVPATPPPPVSRAAPVAKRNVPPFWLKMEYATHTTRALTFPPLFFDRKPKPVEQGGDPRLRLHLDLGLNFAWHSERAQKDWWVQPFLFYRGKGPVQSGWFVPPLLMGFRKTGETYTLGQLPLVWAWGNKYVRNVFVLPVYYHQKTPGSFLGMSALAFWYGYKGRDTETKADDLGWFVAGPAYIGVTKGLKRVDFSLAYIGFKNRAKGIRSHTSLPLFHWQSTEFGNRKELWTLPFVRRVDVARQRSAWAVPPLLTFLRRDHERTLLAVTPLLWRHRDALHDRTRWVVGPYGSIRDPNQRVHWFAPLVLTAHDRRRDARAVAIFPLFYNLKSPERRAFVSFVAFHQRDPSGARVDGVPLALTMASARPDGTRKMAIAGGLVWRSKTPSRRPGDDALVDRWGVGPLAYGTRSATHTSVGVIPLVMHFGAGKAHAHQVVTPLFWHVRSGRDEARRDTWVVGPGYAQRSKGEWLGGVAPLVFLAGGERQRYAVVPLALLGHRVDVASSTAKTISPWFVRVKSPTARTLGVGLLAWDAKAPNERHTAFAPLYLRTRKGARTAWVTPLGAAVRNGDALTWGAVAAYGMKGPTRRGFGIAPLVHHEVRTGERPGSTTALFPLWLRDRRPHRSLDGWSPLVWRTKVTGSHPRTTWFVLPFYGRQRAPGGVDFDGGLGWAWVRDPVRRTHTVVAGPFFHRKTRKHLQTGFLPVHFWHDSTNLRAAVTFPLHVTVHKKLEQERTTVVLPLWFDRRIASGRRTWVAFPLLLGVRGQHNFTRVGMLLPGVIDVYRLGKNERLTGWVPFWFDYKKCGYRIEDDASCRYRLRGSAPLFLWGKGPNRKTHGALVYVWDRNGDSKRLMTWVGGFHFKPGEKLAWYAGPLYRGVTNTHKTHAFLPPLFFHRQHRTKDFSTTIIAAPLYVGQHKNDRRWFQTSLVYWQFRAPHQISIAIAPPVFFHKNVYKEQRLTWLLPLFVHNDQPGNNRLEHALLPLAFGYGRDATRETAVQVPLLWHFVRGERQVTLGAFLWYDVRREGRATQLVPLAFTHARREDRDTWVVGPGLAWWQSWGDPQKPDRSWRVLFGLFGGGSVEGQRYAVIFGGRVKLRGQAKVRPKRVAPTKAQVREQQLAERERREDGKASRTRTGAAEAGTSRKRKGGGRTKGAPTPAPAPAPAPTSAPKGP